MYIPCINDHFKPDPLSSEHFTILHKFGLIRNLHCYFYVVLNNASSDDNNFEILDYHHTHSMMRSIMTKNIQKRKYARAE